MAVDSEPAKDIELSCRLTQHYSGTKSSRTIISVRDDNFDLKAYSASRAAACFAKSALDNGTRPAGNK